MDEDSAKVRMPPSSDIRVLSDCWIYASLLLASIYNERRFSLASQYRVYLLWGWSDDLLRLGVQICANPY